MDIVLPLLVVFVCMGTSTADDGWFWHVTDFHFDFTYSNKDLSCNGNVTKHGEFGDYWCDSPWTLISSSVEYMKSTKPDVDFILWTGDNVLHTGDENLSTDINDDILTNITNLLFGAFPTTTIYATFGNHDYFPNNQYPPHGNDLYNRTFINWRKWIGNVSDQETSFRKGGYYTVVTAQGIRIVATNTNLYYTSNKVTTDIEDPADQFKWLEDVLKNATDNGEKVMVIGHIPPGISTPDGKPWMYQNFNNKLSSILRKYSDVIVATHFGHEHEDNFRVIYKSGVPVISQFCAPSVTPWRYKIKSRGITGPAHNPAVRLVKYDRKSGRNLNIIQYHMDLPQSNIKQTPVWKMLYNATRDYQISDVTPTSLHELIQKMKVENSQEFQNFMKWHVVNVAEDLMEECGDRCKTYMLCNFGNIEQTTYDDCMKTTVGSADFVKTNTAILTFFFLFVKLTCD